MLLSFDITTLPEPTEEELKTLMAVIMQNSLMIQQLQLMVVLKQKEIEEEELREESQRQRENVMICLGQAYWHQGMLAVID